MPFVRFTPVARPAFPQQAFSHPADPFVDLLAAALAAEATPSQFQSKAAANKPAQCQTRSCPPRQSRVVKRFITPRFDISETEDAYVIEGELPGVSDKSSVSVDFDDAQTIVIKGEISRVKPQASKQTEEEPKQELTEEALQASAAAQVETVTTTTAEGETVVYDDASETSAKSKPKPVTIEDEVDESETASNASFEVIDGPVLTKADKGKAPAKDTDVEMTEAAEKPAQPTASEKTQKPAEKTAKYWISERQIGVFERKFKFRNLIDQDNVRASLENGLLTIVIPKREAFVRSIFIY